MAITTTVRPRYAFQMLLMLVLCLGLGLWGAWDFFVKIPDQVRAYERFRVCEAVRDTLDLYTSSSTEAKTRQTRRDEAVALVKTEIESLIERETELGDVNLNPENEVERERQYQQLKEAVESLRGGEQENWLQVLAIFQASLNRPPAVGQPLRGPHQMAWNLASQGISAFDDAEPPSKWDRATQIVFMSCLLGVPWILWSLVRTKSQVYRLDDDGTVVTPEGTFSKDDIADIDMERWMKKSIAYLETSDGQRIKLDDLYYKNLHLIVGAIASEKYPDQWTEDARMVKHDDEEAAESGSAEAEADREPAADESPNADPDADAEADDDAEPTVRRTMH